MSGVAVTVVLPARDAEATIGDQVRAVLGQRLDRPWELVVVDDASADGTAAAAGRAAAGDGRFRLVTSPRPRGASGARNLGAACGTGAVLVFCDADDVVQPGWLAALEAAAADHDVVGGRCDDTLLNPVAVQRRRPAHPADGLPLAWGRVPYALGANVAVRRSRLDDLGGWDESVRQGTDVDLCVRARRAGCAVGWAPGAVVAYRYRSRRVEGLVQAYRWGVADAVLARRHAPVLVDAGGSGARLAPALGRVARRRDSLGRLVAFGAGTVVGGRR